MRQGEDRRRREKHVAAGRPRLDLACRLQIVAAPTVAVAVAVNDNVNVNVNG